MDVRTNYFELVLGALHYETNSKGLFSRRHVWATMGKHYWRYDYFCSGDRAPRSMNFSKHDYE